jgi:hypothetical protein
MGESFGSWAKGNDEAVMPFVDMANIACGMHASDPTTMARTVQLACRFGVSIGAHPGYPDLLGFGRRELALEAEELEACVLYQIGALDGICRAQGRRVEYVKPHGALYNRMMRDQATLDSIIAAVRRYDAGLPLVVLGADESANAALRERAAGQGVKSPPIEPGETKLSAIPSAPRLIVFVSRMSIPNARISRCQRTKLNEVAKNVHANPAINSGQWIDCPESSRNPSRACTIK